MKNDRISASSVNFTFWLLIPLFARTEAEFAARIQHTAKSQLRDELTVVRTRFLPRNGTAPATTPRPPPAPAGVAIAKFSIAMPAAAGEGGNHAHFAATCAGGSPSGEDLLTIAQSNELRGKRRATIK
jgi:hypothetical protein